MSDNVGGLVLGVAGAAVGAFFGFPGLGFAVGSAAGSVLFPPENRLPDVSGPRLNDLRVQASTYGLAIPEIWGSYRLAGNVIWSIPIQERTNTETVESGGKGGPSATQDRTTYTYDVSFAVGLAAGPCDGVGRIWADGKLIWDFRSTGVTAADLAAELASITNQSALVNSITFYPGDETQLPDPLMESFLGAGNVPAYRGLTYVVFDTLQLQKFGNRIPNLEFELIRSGTFTSGLNCLQLPTIYDTTVGDTFGRGLGYARPNGRYPDRNVPNKTVSSMAWLGNQGGTGPGGGERFVEWIHDILGNVVAEDRFTISNSEFSAGGIGVWQCPIYGLAQERAFFTRAGPNNIDVFFRGQRVGTLVTGRTSIVHGAYWDEEWGQLFVTVHDFFTIGGDKTYMKRYQWNPFVSPAISQADLQDSVNLTNIEQTNHSWTPRRWRDYILTWNFTGFGTCGKLGSIQWFDPFNFGTGFGGTPVGKTLIELPPGIDTPDCHHDYDIDPTTDTLYWNAGPWNRDQFQPACPGTSIVQEIIKWVYSDANGRWEAPSGTQQGVPCTVYQPHINGDSAFPVSLCTDACPEGGGYGIVVASTDPLVLVGFKYCGGFRANDSAGTQPIYQAYGPETYRRAFWFGGGIVAGTAPLSQIVEDLCADVGLSAGDLDVTELTDTVYGFARTREGAARNSIGSLQSAYFFDGLESDYILKFPKRGRSVTATVVADELAGHEPGQEVPDDVEPRITQELELAREITVKHIDQNKAYQQGFQYARRLITESNIIDNVDLPIVLTPTEARQASEKLLYNNWQQRTVFTLRLPRDFAAVDPTDVIDVTDGDGNTYRFRVLTTDYSLPLLVSMECAPEESGIYTSIIPGGEAPDDTQSPFVPVSSLFLCLDIPLLLEEQNNPGFYLAVYPAGTGTWGGSAVYRSFDDGVSFNFAATGISGARFGVVAAATPTGPTTLWDEVTQITVQWDQGDPPTSATRPQVLNGANVAALGLEAGGWEIFQYTTVVDNGGGEYVISDLLRGRRGTEWKVDDHQAGERLVLLTTPTILDIPNQTSQIGLEQLIRAATIGQQLTAALERDCTPESVRLKPFSPVHIGAVRDVGTSDIDLDWTRRDRLAGDWLNGGGTPMSEDTEEYEVDIIDPGGPTVVRTVTGLTSEAYTYTLADQTTDFGGAATDFDVEIFQISAAVGRGYPGEANIQV